MGGVRLTKALFIPPIRTFTKSASVQIAHSNHFGTDWEAWHHTSRSGQTDGDYHIGSVKDDRQVEIETGIARQERSFQAPLCPDFSISFPAK